MNFENVKLDRDGAVVTLTINRPKALNALNEATLCELEAAFKSLDEPQTRAIILTGAGDKAFVAGADIAAMRKMDQKRATEFARLGHRVLCLIENHVKPVIAAVNGYALGGGCELALACDIRLASEQAKFGQPEINLGIMCGWGATQRLPRLVGPGWAKQLIFSGDMIDAVAAERIGLVNRVVPVADLLVEAEKMAARFAAKPPVALSYSKRAINTVNESHQPQGFETEMDFFARCFDTEDQKEGMGAFLEKRKPAFKGR